MNTQGMIPLKEDASKKISDRYQEKTYTKGATCIYGDTLYRAKANIDTAEEWNADHWEETNMETIRAEMASELSSVNANKTESITVTFLNSKLTLNKVGRVVQVSYLGDTVSNVSVGNLGKVAAIPSGFKPISRLCVLNLLLSDIKIQLTLFQDGTIEAYNYGIAVSKTSTCRYTFSYVTKD